MHLTDKEVWDIMEAAHKNEAAEYRMEAIREIVEKAFLRGEKEEVVAEVVEA